MVSLLLSPFMKLIFPPQFEWSFPNVNQLYHFLPVSAQPRNKPLWKVDVISYWKLTAQVIKEPRSQRKDGGATHRLGTAEERATTTQGTRRDKGEYGYYWSPESGVTWPKWEWPPAYVEREKATGQIQLQLAMLPKVERVEREHSDVCLPTTTQFSNSFPLAESSQKPTDTGAWEMQPAGIRQASTREGLRKDMGPIRPSTGWLPFQKCDSVPLLKASA